MVIVYFLVVGVAGYVLPRYNNAVYITVESGDHFGLIDLVYDSEILNISTKMTKKAIESDSIHRRFTVQALIECELLTLTLEELDALKFEFPDIFQELFQNSIKRLKGALKQKYEAIKLCETLSHSKHVLKNQESTLPKTLGRTERRQRVDKLKKKVGKKDNQQLTKNDVPKISNFLSNAISLKKIDEAMENDEDESMNISGRLKTHSD